MPKKTTLANKQKRLRITPITRKQALSYNMTATPNRAARANGMGVTAISAVNGKGAYDANYRRRYASTLAALRGRSSTPNAGDAMFYYRNAKKSGKAAKAAPKAAKAKSKPAKAAPKAARAKYAKGKSPKQLANLLKGRQKLADMMCGTIKSPRPGFLSSAGKPAMSKKAKANRRRGRRNGVASYISNVRRNVMSFSEWSKSMKANRPRRSAKKRRAKHNPLAQALANARRRRRARRNAAPGVRKIDVRAYSRGPVKAAAKKAAPKKAVKGKKKAKKNLAQAAANRRRRARKNLAQAAANRRHRRVHRNLAQAAANKRRRARRNGRTSYISNRRRRARRNGIASYISNIGVSEIMEVVKQGAVIGGGLIAHKVLTNLVVSNVDMLKGMKFGKSVTGVAVAAVGIPAATMLVPGALGKDLAIGMGAALVHTVLVDVLSSAGQSSIASMLGDYTEESEALPAAGYGAYYEFGPGQSYDGMGAYYEFGPGQSYDGLGEYIEQGAAGFGEYIEQGAAGFGDFEQAAAGFGSPMLAQAAAGVGEYVVQGAEGIGEYEQVVPEYTAPAVTREGISASLSSVEAALSMAEAAAGVGGFGNVDASLQQIVYPKGQALDIKDDPGGSRSGVFFGGNGVFGP